MQVNSLGATNEAGFDMLASDMKLVYSESENYPFTLDGIFPQSCSQAEVFEEVKEFLQSCIDGHNVCIFAYGQTSAGKTFTMEGPNKNELYEEKENTFKVRELSGILPRTAIFLFEEQARLKKQVGCQLSFEISAIENYCNKLRDLFSINSSKIVDVKTDPNKKFFVENATW